jgi:hypothetical protein
VFGYWVMTGGRGMFTLLAFCIMKNISYNNKGDVLTIASSITVLVLLVSLQKMLEEVFNFHVKLNYAITRKVNLILFFFIVL